MNRRLIMDTPASVAVEYKVCNYPSAQIECTLADGNLRFTADVCVRADSSLDILYIYPVRGAAEDAYWGLPWPWLQKHHEEIVHVLKVLAGIDRPHAPFLKYPDHVVTYLQPEQEHVLAGSVFLRYTVNGETETYYPARRIKGECIRQLAREYNNRHVKVLSHEASFMRYLKAEGDKYANQDHNQ